MLRSKIRNDGDDSSHHEHVTTDDDLGIEDQEYRPKLTSSVIEGYPIAISGNSHQNEINDAFATNIEVSDDNDDDDISSVLADSATPLLKREI